jgi:hypothetical protein
MDVFKSRSAANGYQRDLETDEIEAHYRA